MSMISRSASRTIRKNSNMNTGKTGAKKTVFAIVVISLIVGYVLLRSRLLEFTFQSSSKDFTQQRRVLLLYQTDHEALLKAGREILSQGPKDTMNYQYYGIIYLGGFPVPRGVRIPKIIRDLKTYDTRINFAGYLFLEMQGGVTGFGVRIYPEGFKARNRYFSYGNRELLPGLWYYDYGYSHDPEYNKRIDEIMQEGKWEDADKSTANQQ